MKLSEQSTGNYELEIVDADTGEVIYSIAPSTLVMPNNGTRMVVFSGAKLNDHSNWVSVFRNADLSTGYQLARRLAITYALDR